MRQVRIYQAGDYQMGEQLRLTEEAGQHVGVVLRMQPGEHITLFNGKNTEFLAQILEAHKKRVTVLVETQSTSNRESPLAIHLAQAISKSERMEIVVQKAVELGVASITPLITEHLARKFDTAEKLAKKQQQWQAIAVSACEQCGRNQIPPIHSPLPLSVFLTQQQFTHRFVLHPAQALHWRDYPPPQGEVVLLIGPEGGLSEEEFARTKEARFAPLTLGPRILRTETAAIAGLSIMQALWGDL